MELRKRRRAGEVLSDSGTSLEAFLDAVEGCKNLVVFTGSGLSATSGMSMFSTRNGLYDRARKKFKIQDGIKLFTYSFYKQRRSDVQAFFAQIYSEAQGSNAAPGHHALAQCDKLHRMRRHYTLNIDGLSEVVGMSTWHHETNPGGTTVEMHGNIRQLVCPECHHLEPLSRTFIETMKANKPVRCTACSKDDMRFKIMLYDDDQGDCITPEHVFETLEEDLEVADGILWIGISFEQSASVEYFRKVRGILGSLGRLDQVPQAIINPSDDAFFNIVSSVCNSAHLQLMDVRAKADEALPAMAERMKNYQGTTSKLKEDGEQSDGSKGSARALPRVGSFARSRSRAADDYVRWGDIKGEVKEDDRSSHGKSYVSTRIKPDPMLLLPRQQQQLMLLQQQQQCPMPLQCQQQLMVSSQHQQQLLELMHSLQSNSQSQPIILSPPQQPSVGAMPVNGLLQPVIACAATTASWHALLQAPSSHTPQPVIMAGCGVNGMPHYQLASPPVSTCISQPPASQQPVRLSGPSQTLLDLLPRGPPIIRPLYSVPVSSHGPSINSSPVLTPAGPMPAASARGQSPAVAALSGQALEKLLGNMAPMPMAGHSQPAAEGAAVKSEL